MGEELDTPIKQYSPKDDKNTYLRYGLNQVQGWKKSMEDFTVDFMEPDQENFSNVFGIFDGHGGREVPKYLSLHFVDYLKNNSNFQNGKFKDALNETFFKIDESFKSEEAQKELLKYSEEIKPSKEQEIKAINNLCAPGEKLNDDELEQIMTFNEVFDPRNIENANIAEFTGSTGIILFLGDKNIYVANAGNSRCLVIDKDGKLINKTKDHTMNDPEEKKRVELARSFNEEEEKKKEEEQGHTEYLDSTRGFGDWEFKGNEWIDQKDQEVSVEPDILEVPINDVQYLIMGSHGMFESGSNDNDNDDTVNKEVCKFFMDKIKDNPDKPYSEIIKEYFEKIIPEKNDGNINTKGLDNMSCIVVNLMKEKIAEFIKKRDIMLEEKRKKEEEEKKRKKEEDRKRREEERKRKKQEQELKEKKEKEKVEGKNEIKEEPKNEIKEENKNEKKEEPKVEGKEKPKNEIKEEVKNEIKEEPKVEGKEEPKKEIKEEPKVEVKEELKNEIKVEPNVEVKEEVKNKIKVEPNVEVKEEVKNEIKEEPKVQEKEEVKNEIKEEPKVQEKEEVKNEIKEEPKVQEKEEVKNEIKEEPKVQEKEEVKNEIKEEPKKEENIVENKEENKKKEDEIAKEEKKDEIKPENVVEEKKEIKPEEKTE